MRSLQFFRFARLSCATIGLALVAPLASAEGQAADLLQRQALISSKVQRTTLPNGLRVSLLPTDEIEGPVAATFVLRFGDATSLAGRAVEAHWLGLLSDAGVGSIGQDSLQAAFEALGATVMFHGRDRDIIVELVTTPQRLIPSLDLVLRVLRTPAYPDGRVKEMMDVWVRQLASEATSPGSVGERELRRRLTPYPAGHPLETRALPADSAAHSAVTGARMRDLHRLVVGATDGDFAVTGDFNADAVLAWARRSLGTWRSGMAPTRVAQQQFSTPATEVVVAMSARAADGALLLGRQLALSPRDPDFATLEIANLVLGDMVGNTNRLTTRLVRPRRVASNAYSWIEGASGDTVSAFMLKVVGRRDSMPRVETLVREELARLLRDGITDAELRSAKQEWYGLRQYLLSETPRVATVLADEGRRGMTTAEFERSVRHVDALTSEQVLAALRRHIDVEKMVTVRVNMP